MIEWLAIVILILFGLGMVIVELIFIPGTTIVGVLGFVMTLMGIIVSFQSYGTGVGLTVLGISFAISIAVVVYSFNNDSWQRFALKTSMSSRVNEDNPIDVLLGAEGIAISSLKPFGKGEFRNKAYEVKTNGDYLESGARIRIIKVEPNRIIVEPIT